VQIETGTSGIGFDFGGEIPMTGIAAFGLTLLALAALAGRPYPQSWYGRWGGSGR